MAEQSIFASTDYKSFIVARLPSGGHGQFARLAQSTNLHKSTINQVFKGDRDLTPEQAERVAMYLGLTPEETKALIFHVEMQRAGTPQLREFFSQQLEELKRRSASLARRVARTRALQSEERAIFYSHWAYSAVQILSSIPEYQNLDSISDRLKLPRSFVRQVVNFLLQTGLCIQKEGHIEPGVWMSHLEGGSPLVSQHHRNWRGKASEKHPHLSPTKELAYSAVMSLSERDAQRIREIFAQAVEKSNQIAKDSACERLYCVGIDWVEV